MKNNEHINPENRDFEKRLEQMSPFEIKNRLIEMAQADAHNSTVHSSMPDAATPTG